MAEHFSFEDAVRPAGVVLPDLKTWGPCSTPPSTITLVFSPFLHTSLLPTLCPIEMRHWQIFIRSLIPARARRLPLFYFTDQALSQDEGFVCALPSAALQS